jgi:flagella basal body P-ring formation protein FlgA
MIKFFSFFIFFSLQILKAETCSVDLYSKIYRFDSSQPLTQSEFIKGSNCYLKTLNQVGQLISRQKGEFSITQIENEIGNGIVHITPRKIQLLDLSTVLRDQLVVNSNLYFFDIRSLNGLKNISLSEEESLKASCESCTSYGEKNIKIDIYNPISNNLKSNWIVTKIFAKIKVFKAKRSLSFQTSKLSPEDFYEDETFTMMPESILGTLEHIEFFKPNKTIIQGATILSMDLQPINIVTFGIPVKAILKNSSINLSKMASPTRSAQFGEMVEIKINNNKSITGKVIDYNQVVIEL